MKFFSVSSILVLLVLSFTIPILSYLSHQPLISSLELQAHETCPYTLVVTTSCFSPYWSTDQITIVFGDAYGDKVVALGLDEPLSSGGGGFKKCSLNTFQVKGQCLSTICSIYIYRSGPEGWIPKTIEIYNERSKSVKFHFHKNVPENVWYGHNNCNNTYLPPPPPPPPPLYLPPPPPPPFSPIVPPLSPPYFPPEPSVPPPAPSAASGCCGGASNLIVFAVFAFAFAVAVVVKSLLND